MLSKMGYSLGRIRRAAGQARGIALGNRATRQAIARDQFFRLAARFTDVVLADSGTSQYFVSTHDKVVSRRTFRDGAFDAEQMARIMAVGHIPIAGRTVLDIGANIGTTSVEMIRQFGARHVIAFEPDPDNYHLLSLNILANGLQGSVVAHQLAVSDRVGAVEFGRSKTNWGDHRVMRGGRDPAREATSVMATTIDELVSGGVVDLGDVSMVWMDVQGHEARVLAGATSLIQAKVPVLTEYWPSVLREAGDLESIEHVIASNYRTIINLGDPEAPKPCAPSVLRADDVTELRRAERFVDLWLLP